MHPDLQNTPPIYARAFLLGERLDTRALRNREMVSTNPTGFRTDSGGYVFAFRFGAAVLIGMSPEEEKAVLEALSNITQDNAAIPETEEAEIEVQPENGDQVRPDGTIILQSLGLARLMVVADVLATSAALNHEERRISEAFDQTLPLTADLQKRGLPGHTPLRDLQRQIGQVLSLQHRMVGRVEVGEKPDVLWDHPELERLYARLEDEFELVERSSAIERRLMLMRDTASTLSNYHQTRQSLRLELYIVLLIVVEIFLSLYAMFIRDAH